MNLKEKLIEQEQIAINGMPFKTEFTIEMGSSFNLFTKQEYIEWLEAKLLKAITPQPEGVKSEAFWNDNQVMSFVNWYIELKNLDSRYELENQFIIDSFKAGDAVEKWKATETK